MIKFRWKICENRANTFHANVPGTSVLMLNTHLQSTEQVHRILARFLQLSQPSAYWWSGRVEGGRTDGQFA